MMCLKVKEETEQALESRTPTWAGLWTLSYMPSIYGNDIPTGKPGPQKEEPQGSPSLKEYPNFLCNQIESYILLCFLGYDHRPIDNCTVGTPLQHSCLENPMDGGAWWAAGHGVTKSQT